MTGKTRITDIRWRRDLIQAKQVAPDLNSRSPSMIRHHSPDLIQVAPRANLTIHVTKHAIAGRKNGQLCMISQPCLAIAIAPTVVLLFTRALSCTEAIVKTEESLSRFNPSTPIISASTSRVSSSHVFTRLRIHPKSSCRELYCTEVVDTWQRDRPRFTG